MKKTWRLDKEGGEGEGRRDKPNDGPKNGDVNEGGELIEEEGVVCHGIKHLTKEDTVCSSDNDESDHKTKNKSRFRLKVLFHRLSAATRPHHAFQEGFLLSIPTFRLAMVIVIVVAVVVVVVEVVVVEQRSRFFAHLFSLSVCVSAALNDGFRGRCGAGRRAREGRGGV